MSAQWTFELTAWVEEHEPYLVSLTAKYAPIWGITFDEAKAWIMAQLPAIATTCRGALTGAYVAKALINRRITLKRSDDRHNAEHHFGTVDFDSAANVVVANRGPELHEDGQVLTVSKSGQVKLVTVYDGMIAGSFVIQNVQRVMIEADEDQVRVIDCE